MTTTIPEPTSIEEWFTHFYVGFAIALILSGTWEHQA